MSSNNKTICIVGASRTALGSFGGSLSKFTASDLGGFCIKESLSRANIQGNQVDQVFMGNVVSAGQGQAPAKQAALKGGIPVDCPCTTVNKMCASGLKAIMLGCASILTNESEVVVAGGFESMSQAPFYSMDTRFGKKFGHAQLIDGLARDGLRCAYSDEEMGRSATLCACENNISRQEQDEYTARSYKLARDSTNNGFFSPEIVPIEIKSKKGNVTIVNKDEEATLRNVTYDTLKKLPGVFQLPKKYNHVSPVHEKSVTAGNSSVISDGAAAVVLCSEEYAKKNKLEILAVIDSYADASNDPEHFTTAPAKAMKKALDNANLSSFNDINLFEINEAFSVVPIINMKLLDIPIEKVNIRGGACSIGHPIGASGARILVTALYALENNQKGMLGICNGGGGASAMIISRKKQSKL